MPTPKWIRGTSRSSRDASTAAECGMHVLAVVGDRQRADPGVEQLHRRGTRLHLHPEEGRGDLGQPAQQPVPKDRFAVHQRLGPLVVARRSALHEVRRERERRPGKPDQRRRAELGDQVGHRLGHVGHVGRLQRSQPREVRRRADRRGDHRTDAGHDVEVDPDRLQRHHDVGEQDRRVNPVPPHRLQGQLDDQVRASTSLSASRRPPALCGTRATSGLPAA